MLIKKCNGNTYPSSDNVNYPFLFSVSSYSTGSSYFFFSGSAVAWWLMPRTPDPEVSGVRVPIGSNRVVSLSKAHLLLSFFLSIDTESIKFRSSSQVWWVAKF